MQRNCALPTPTVRFRLERTRVIVSCEETGKRPLCPYIYKNEAMKKRNGLPPIHPGEIPREDVLPSVGLSVTAAAKSLGVSRQMLHGILAERKPLSAVMCLKIARLFGGSPEIWVRVQATYDLKKSEQDKRIMARAARIVPIAAGV